MQSSNSPLSPQTVNGPGFGGFSTQSISGPGISGFAPPKRPETSQSVVKESAEISQEVSANQSQVAYNPHIDIVQIQRSDSPDKRTSTPGIVSYPAKQRNFTKSAFSPTGPSDSLKYRNFRNNQRKQPMVSAMSQIDYNSLSIEKIATTHKFLDEQERDTNLILEQLNKRYNLQRQLQQNQVKVPSTNKSLRDQLPNMNLNSQRNFLAINKQVSVGLKSQNSCESGDSNIWGHSPLYFYDSKMASQMKIKSLVNLPQTQEQIEEKEESPRVVEKSQSHQSLQKKSGRSTSVKKLTLQTSQKRKLEKPEKQHQSPQQFYMVQQEKNTYKYDGEAHYRELLEKNTQNERNKSEEKDSHNKASKPSLFAVNNPDLDDELKKQQPKDNYNFNKSSTSHRKQKFGQNSSQKKSLYFESSIKNIQQKGINTNSSFEFNQGVEAQEQAPLFLMKLNTSSKVLQRHTSGSFESNRNQIQIFQPSQKNRANSSHFRLSQSGKPKLQHSKKATTHQSKATLEYVDVDERPLMHEEQIQEYLENFESNEKLIEKNQPEKIQQNSQEVDLERDPDEKVDVHNEHDEVMLDLHNLDVKIQKSKVQMKTQRNLRVSSATQFVSSNQLSQKKSQQNVSQQNGSANKPRRSVARMSSRNKSFTKSSKQAGGKQFTNIVIVPKVESANAQMQSDHLSIRSANYQNPIYSDDSNQNTHAQFSFRGTVTHNTRRVMIEDKKYEVTKQDPFNNIISINEMQQSTQRLNTQERSQRDHKETKNTLMFSTRNHFQVNSDRQIGLDGNRQNKLSQRVKEIKINDMSHNQKTPKQSVDTPGERSFGVRPNEDSINYNEYSQNKFLKGGRYFQNHHPSIQQIQPKDLEKENLIQNSLGANISHSQELKQKPQTFGRKTTLNDAASVPISLDDAQSKKKALSNIRTPLSESDAVFVSTGMDQPDKPFVETTTRALKSQKDLKQYKMGSQLFSPLSVKVFEFQEAMNQLGNNTSNNLLARNLSNRLPSDIEKMEKVAQQTVSEAQKQQQFCRGNSSTNVIDQMIATRPGPKPKSQQTKLRKNIGELLALTQEPLCLSYSTESKLDATAIMSKSSEFHIENNTMIVVSSEDENTTSILKPSSPKEFDQTKSQLTKNDKKKEQTKVKRMPNQRQSMKQMMMNKFDNIEDMLLCDPKLLFQKKQRLRALQDVKNNFKNKSQTAKANKKGISSELDSKLTQMLVKREQSTSPPSQKLLAPSNDFDSDDNKSKESKCKRCSQKNYRQQMVTLARRQNMSLGQISPFQNSHKSQQFPLMTDKSRAIWVQNLKMLSNVNNIYRIQKILNEHDRLFGVTPDKQNLSPQSQVALFNKFCIQEGIIPSTNIPTPQNLNTQGSNGSPNQRKVDQACSPNSNDLSEIEIQNQSQMAKMSQFGLEDSVLHGKYLAESKYKSSQTRNQGSLQEHLDTSALASNQSMIQDLKEQLDVHVNQQDHLQKVQLFQDQKFEHQKEQPLGLSNNTSGLSCQLDPWKVDQMSKNQYLRVDESQTQTENKLKEVDPKSQSQGFRLVTSPSPKNKKATVNREFRRSQQFKRQSYDALFEAQHSYSMKLQKLQNHRKERIISRNSNTQLQMSQDLGRLKTVHESETQIYAENNVFSLPTRVTSPMSLNIPNAANETRNMQPDVFSDGAARKNTEDSLFETQAYQGIRFKKTKSPLISRNQKFLMAQNLSHYSKQQDRSSGQNGSINLLKRAARQRKEQASKQQNESEIMVSKIQMGQRQGTNFVLKKHPQKPEYQYVKMARPPVGQVSSEQAADKSYQESMAIQMSKQQKGKFEESMQINSELANQKGATDKTFEVDLDGNNTTYVMNQSGKDTTRQNKWSQGSQIQNVRGWSGKESKNKPTIKNINFW